MWLWRFWAWLRRKEINLICIRQADTWTWGFNLGPMTPGNCCKCGEPIYYEKQNGWIKNKICHVCAGM